MFFREQVKKFYYKTKQRSEIHSAIILCVRLCIAQ